MKVGLEKLESHEGVAVKALLDSGATGLFIDTTFAREKGFKMERMKNPLLVKNVDGTVNVGGAITHQVECNMCATCSSRDMWKELGWTCVTWGKQK